MLRSGPVRLGLLATGSACFAIAVGLDVLPTLWLVVGPLLLVLAETLLSAFVGRYYSG